jgi:selenide,water dikinase
MTTLNKTAAEVITTGRARASLPPDHVEQSSVADDRPGTANGCFSVHSLTDVTGFGLIGHAREMALASNVSLRIRAGEIRLLDGALECVHAGYIPGGLKANREFAECLVAYEGDIGDDVKTILFDPQTAGGLLISVAEEDAVELVRALNAAGVPAVEVGEVLPPAKPMIVVQQ